ncbi:MAG: hypothetical protein QOJ07_1171 [Thermoleophilaceae bacterium]|nr:hypothetical protein [Thermoleophilaceae bacterium]
MGGPPPVPGDGRSDDERERARRARETRRGIGDGQAPASGGDRKRRISELRAASAAGGRRDPRRAARADRPQRQPRQPREPRRPRREREPREPGAVHRRRRIFAVLGAVLLLIAIWFLMSLYQPFAGAEGDAKTITIKPKASVGDIGQQLADEGIVPSKFFFELRATISGRRGDLKPGTYTLHKDMTYADTLDVLAQGPPPNTINVVVPEGKSRTEIARSITESGLKGDYRKATLKSPALKPSRYGAKGAKNLEGFLFPATYELKRGQSVDVLVAKQLEAFKQNFAGVSLATARRKNLTPYDVLVIASLVERETAAPRERKLIASVIYNRLSMGIPLGIDATTRFATNNWDRPIKASDFASNSPYNTRKQKGLPPGPIGNPGLASIRAAARPASSPFVFYVANPCKPGTHTFTRTLAEFNAAVAKYNSARAAAGGKAPKGC